MTKNHEEKCWPKSVTLKKCDKKVWQKRHDKNVTQMSAMLKTNLWAFLLKEKGMSDWLSEWWMDKNTAMPGFQVWQYSACKY